MKLPQYQWSSTFETDNLQLSPTSHFANDLGLDSLDTVEVVMAIEEVSLDVGIGITRF
jgi:acyl carrier protein